MNLAQRAAPPRATTEAGLRPWRVLLVDDEPLARLRLRQLLVDLGPAAGCVQILEAADARQALACIGHCRRQQADVAAAPLLLVLVDIRMPGLDGLSLAHAIRAKSPDGLPALAFVTASQDHAVQAFELHALDYLTKPVRRERLQVCLDKLRRWAGPGWGAPAVGPDGLRVEARGRQLWLPLADVIYVQAWQKYLTVRTERTRYLLSGTLADLQRRWPEHWLQVHRNALVAGWRLRELRHGRAAAPDAGVDGAVPTDDSRVGAGTGWWVWLHGCEEPLPVSRRQLAPVRRRLGAVAG